MLFKLKDTEVKEITPIYKDERYEESWCETCGGEWVDAEIEVEIVFNNSTHMFIETITMLKSNQLLLLLTIYSLT